MVLVQTACRKPSSSGSCRVRKLLPSSIVLLACLDGEDRLFTGIRVSFFYNIGSPDWSQAAAQFADWQLYGMGRTAVDYIKLPLRVILAAGEATLTSTDRSTRCDCLVRSRLLQHSGTAPCAPASRCPGSIRVLGDASQQLRFLIPSFRCWLSLPRLRWGVGGPAVRAKVVVVGAFAAVYCWRLAPDPR